MSPRAPSSRPDQARGACRPRNAVATRDALLRAARCLFSHCGYEQVGVRDIAARAGADPALINRYFGSKQRLFAEVIRGAMSVAEFLEGDRRGFARRLVRSFVARTRSSAAFDPMQLVLRSSSSDVANAIVRDSVNREFIVPLARWLGGPQAHLRASLIAATLGGTDLMRVVLRSRGLAGCRPRVLEQHLEEALQPYVRAT